MEDDAKKERSTLQKVGDTLEGGGLAAIDSLATRVPVVGPLVQAIANTPKYQAEQRAAQAMDMRNKEFIAAAADRADERDLARMKRQSERELLPQQKAAHEAQLKLQQQQAESESRLLPGKEAATAAHTRVALDSADANERKLFSDNATRGMVDQLRQDPRFATMNNYEIESAANSPALRALIEKKYYAGKFADWTQNKNQAAYGSLDRAFAARGWGIVDGPDNKKYIDLGNQQFVPADRETMDAISQEIDDRARNELECRNRYSIAGCLGDPIASGMRRFVKEGATYNRNDWSGTERIFKSAFDGASNTDKAYRVVSQALDDYRDGSLPLKARLEGLQKLMYPGVDNTGRIVSAPILEQLGFSVDGVDMQTNDFSRLIITDVNTGRKFVGLDEFDKFAKANDSIGREMEKTLSRMKTAAVQADDKIFTREAAREKFAQDAQKTALANRKTMLEIMNLEDKRKGKAGEGEATAATWSPQKMAEAVNLYGDGILDIPENKLPAVSNAENVLRTTALRLGALKKNAAGKYVASDDISPELLDRMVGLEKKVFKNAGLDAIAGTGFWSRLKAITSLSEKAASRGRQETALRKIYDDSAKRAEDAKGFLAQHSAAADARNMESAALGMGLRSMLGATRKDAEAEREAKKKHISK